VANYPGAKKNSTGGKMSSKQIVKVGKHPVDLPE